MNTNTPPVVNQTTFRILYFRYREYLMPCVVLVVCALVFIFGIIPQIQQFFDTRDQAQQAQDRLATLNQNITVASSLSETTLDKQLEITYGALPSEKDFAGVVDAISRAAITSGVVLGDYTFQVGDLIKSQATENTIPVALTITGTITDVNRFLATLKEQFPLSDVIDVRISSVGAGISVIFYYKPVTQIRFEAATPLSALTKKEIDELDQLSQGTKTVILPSPLPTPSISISPLASPAGGQ